MEAGESINRYSYLIVFKDTPAISINVIRYTHNKKIYIQCIRLYRAVYDTDIVKKTCVIEISRADYDPYVFPILLEYLS